MQEGPAMVPILHAGERKIEEGPPKIEEGHYCICLWLSRGVGTRQR